MREAQWTPFRLPDVVGGAALGLTITRLAFEKYIHEYVQRDEKSNEEQKYIVIKILHNYTLYDIKYGYVYL